MNNTQDLDLSYLADTLRWLRKAHNLTQQGVADRCGLTTRTIEKLESGKHRPDEQTLRSLSRGLGYERQFFYKPTPAQQAQFLRRLERSTRTKLFVETSIAQSPKDFLAFMDGFHRLQVDCGEVKEGEPLDETMGFFELVRDWGDLWSEIGSRGQLDASRNLADAATRLSEFGYTVHVGRFRQMLPHVERKPLVFQVGLVIVRARVGSETQESALVQLEDGWEVLPEDRVQLPEEWLKAVGAT